MLTAGAACCVAPASTLERVRKAGYRGLQLPHCRRYCTSEGGLALRGGRR